MTKKAMIIILAVLLAIAVFLGMLILVDKVIMAPRRSSPDTPAEATATAAPDESATPEGGETVTPTPEPEPTQSLALAGLIIGIDPGHQGKANTDKEPCAPWGKDKNPSYNNETMKTKTSSGTAGKFTNMPEYIVTLQISLKMKAKLEALGATVVMTREDHNVNLSNIDRAQIGNDANCDVVLRIHCNGADNPSTSGIEAWIRGTGDGTAEYKALGDYERLLAEEMLTYLVNATNAVRRRVNSSDSYTGLNWSTAPSIIIECGFMSNEEEDNKLATDSYQELIAQGFADWLVNSTVLKRQ